MEALTVGEITKAINGTLLKGDEDELISNISTDSRVISSGDLFIALKGEIFDGHDFLESALDKGASATIISQRRLVNSHPKASIILVPDTLIGLQELARYYRGKFSPIFVAITGSVGKTTTKEMTASILSKRMLVLKNESSYNNEVGVPLTLLRLSSSHQVAILEVGMNHPGEIAHLADIIKPSIGVITNVEEVHLEGVGSLEGVAKAKGELIEALGDEGIVILNADNEWSEKLKRLSRGRVITFGVSNEAEVQASEIEVSKGESIQFTLDIDKKRRRIKLPIPGRHNIYNALAAASVAYAIDLDMDQMKKGLADFSPLKGRVNIYSLPKFKLIDDTYNSNPTSLRAALAILCEMDTKGRRVAILGDMLELGRYSEDVHRSMGEFMGGLPLDLLITSGEMASLFVSGAINKGFPSERVYICSTNDEVLRVLPSSLKAGDTILVKGSRGVRMEEIAEEIKKIDIS